MKMFISYARADDEHFIKQLYQDLTEHGFDVWWDREAMESRSRTFLQELHDAIEGAEPPLSICRTQWLDMRNCVPLHERREMYERNIEKLLIK